MKRVLAAGAVVLMLAGAAAAGGRTQPSVTLLDASPLVLRGTGFAPRERVVVRVETPAQSASARVVASASGRFVARFVGIRLTPCTGASIVAKGPSSGPARLKVALRECPGPTLEP